MVNISTLYVDKEAKAIRLIASVGTESYFDNVYIVGVKIDTQDTFTNGTPSPNIIYNRSIDNQKSIDLTITNLDLLQLDFDKLYFIYVITNDGYAPNTPCGLDNDITIGVAADYTSYLNSTLNLVPRDNSCCDIPREFVCKILQYAAFRIAIETKNYNKAIYYYNTYLKPGVNSPLSQSCGCHG